MGGGVGRRHLDVRDHASFASSLQLDAPARRVLYHSAWRAVARTRHRARAAFRTIGFPAPSSAA